ncbi:type II toxin-antitoxin system VapC family toxin [Escherichia coli]|nr:type II toxin-antitoxin system VapC family toxin [Escherichia coli]
MPAYYSSPAQPRRRWRARLSLRTAGTPIGPNDTAIAAGAVLVTNNVREFERVPDLMLEDWVK